MPINTKMRYHYTSIRISEVQNSDNIKPRQECGAMETLIHCWWEGKRVQPCWQTVCFLEK